MALTRGRRRPRWRHALLALLDHEALWELAAESYVVWKAGPDYRRLYRQHHNPFLAPFWLLMATVAAITALVSLRINHRR